MICFCRNQSVHIVKYCRKVNCLSPNLTLTISGRPLSTLTGTKHQDLSSGFGFSHSNRSFSALASTSKEFQDAVAKLSQVKETDNSVKLRIYALFKQATVGKNSTKKPGMLDLVGKAKWEAWNSLGDMSKV